MREIERKFLVRELPDLAGLTPIRYERGFLDDNDHRQVRLQRKDDQYELEIKTRFSDLEYQKSKTELTLEEYQDLSRDCKKIIVRDSYLISRQPQMTIKKYLGDYEGLYRVEVEFESVAEAEAWVPPGWVGAEITGTVLGNDSRLVKLGKAEFLEVLEKMRGSGSST